MTVPSSRHPLALPEFDEGPVRSSTRLERMILVLRPDAEQQQELEALLDAQLDPASPQYHQWLTPESFGQQFGISEADLSQISGWLSAQGFQIDEISPGRRSILFSGNVGQVEAAFHTQMRYYRINGARHLANATEISIPAALADVVHGISSLHDFRKQPMHHVDPQFTYGTSHYLAPADFAIIYDVAALYSASFNGAGQSIAIVGRSNIAVSDVTLFRSTMGLPVNNPTVIVNGTNPGIQPGDQTEALLDVEWSGAVAQMATVQLVVSASTTTSDGVDLSAQYIVNKNLAPVMSTSFGQCEQYMGATENAFWNSLWSQAASQGITAFVSAGDSGAAGCDSGTTGTMAAVSGLSSTPYNVAVGGLEFNDTANPSQYWSPNTNATTDGSALSYIPETVWNESGLVSGGSGLWAGGGGVSTIYAKPSWQAGAGVPNDNHRDVPDVSLSAAGHDGYLIVMDGGLGAVGGTSASSPSFAGLMALVVQKANARQGNANPTFYGLATKQAAGGAAVFHDTTVGNNSVPGVTGFTAGVGYDQGSGLGSVDALQLVNHWGDLVTTSGPKATLAASPATISMAPGATSTTKITSTVSSGFSAAVALSAAGLPSGVTAAFAPASFSAPGSGTSTLTLSASSSAVPGTYSVSINGSGSATGATVSLTISGPPQAALTASPATVALTGGTSGTSKITSTVNNGFNAAVALSVTGLPAGVTASLSPTSFSAPGSGSSTLTLTAASSATPGTYTVTINGPGNGQSTPATLSVTVSAPPQATLSASPTAITVALGSSGTAKVTSTLSNGFNAAVALSTDGLPAGVTATLSPSTFSAPGSGTSTLTLTVSSSAVPGTYSVTVKSTSAATATTIALTIPAPPKAALTVSPATLTVVAGSSGTTKVTSTVSNGFSSALALSVAGLPSGVTAAFSPASFSAPGSGTSTVTLTASSSAVPGTYNVTINGTASGTAAASNATGASLSLIVSAPPKATLTAYPNAISFAAGSSGTTSVTSTVSNGFNAAVSLSVSGLPSGVTAALSPTSFSAPGNGSSTVALTATSSAAPGTYNVSINGPGNGLSTAASLSLTISAPVPPSLTLALNATTANLAQAGSTPLGLTVSGKPGAAVALSVSGLPSGVTAAFAPASLASPGTGTSTLTFTANSSASLNTSIVTVTASGGGITKTQTLMLTVIRPFTASLSAGSASVKAGAFVTENLSANIAAGFNSPLTLSASGLPTGVTCTFSPASLSGAGNQTSTVKFTAASNAVTGKSSTVTISVSGGGVTLTNSFALTVTN